MGNRLTSDLAQRRREVRNKNSVRKPRHRAKPLLCRLQCGDSVVERMPYQEKILREKWKKC